MPTTELYNKLSTKRRLAVDWKIDQSTDIASLSDDARSEKREEYASAPAVVGALVKEHEIDIRERWRDFRRLLAAGGVPESLADLSPNASAAVNDEVGRLAAEWITQPENNPIRLGGFIDFTVQSLLCEPAKIEAITKAWEERKGLAERIAAAGSSADHSIHS